MPRIPERIRLLVEQDGRKVWRTLDGVCLAGAYLGNTYIGIRSEDAYWLVIQALSGKLVVYRYDLYAEPGTIQVFDSFEAMEPKVPADVFDKAAVSAGLRKPEEFPEIPLDV